MGRLAARFAGVFRYWPGGGRAAAAASRSALSRRFHVPHAGSDAAGILRVGSGRSRRMIRRTLSWPRGSGTCIRKGMEPGRHRADLVGLAGGGTRHLQPPRAPGAPASACIPAVGADDRAGQQGNRRPGRPGGPPVHRPGAGPAVGRRYHLYLDVFWFRLPGDAYPHSLLLLTTPHLLPIPPPPISLSHTLPYLTLTFPFPLPPTPPSPLSPPPPPSPPLRSYSIACRGRIPVQVDRAVQHHAGHADGHGQLLYHADRAAGYLPRHRRGPAAAGEHHAAALAADGLPGGHRGAGGQLRAAGRHVRPGADVQPRVRDLRAVLRRAVGDLAARHGRRLVADRRCGSCRPSAARC